MFTPQLLSLIWILLWSVCVFSTTVHDNYVTFGFLSGDVDDFAFKLASHAITSGQPWEGVTVGGTTLDVRAGRKGSSGPATFFNQNIGSGAAVGIDDADKRPNDLNVAMTGDLSFNFSGQHFALNHIVIGQGHIGDENNWWFGGEMWGATGNGVSTIINNYEVFVGYKTNSAYIFQVIISAKIIVGVTMHDNYVHFKLPNIENFGFKLTGHQVSDGQPYGGVVPSSESGYGQLDVKAGRHASTTPAMWFDSKLTNGGQALGIFVGAGATPHELNFAISGTMTFNYQGSNYVLDNLAIGQGHSSLPDANNWWFGGSAWRAEGGRVSKTVNGSTVSVSYEMNGDTWDAYTFYLSITGQQTNEKYEL